MNSAKYVDEHVAVLKSSGIPYSEAAWQTALLLVGWAYVFGARGQYCTPANRRSLYKDEHPTIKTACQNFDSTGSCVGCKWYPDCERTRFFDCRGFTYWVLLQIYGWKLMGAGCTSQWNNEANWCAKGEVSDGIPQNVIVCLFYYKKDKNGKRTSTLSHTGLYYNGQTVECSNNVQFSKTLNKKWEVWGVPACCAAEYQKPGENAPISPSKPADNKTDTDILPTLRKGDKGDSVKHLQTLLLERGYDLGKWGADGDFGNATEKAVKQFQRDWGLTEDGVVGKKTWSMLTSSPAKVTFYTVTIPNVTKTQADALVAKYPGAVAKEVN